MSETRMARRAIADIGSVCRHARPASAARWLTSFAAHLVACETTRSLAPADRIWAGKGRASSRRAGRRSRFLVPTPPGHARCTARTCTCAPDSSCRARDGSSTLVPIAGSSPSGPRRRARRSSRSRPSGLRAGNQRLAAHNGVSNRVHVEIALAGGTIPAGATVGVVADDERWAATSHGAPRRLADVSVPQLGCRWISKAANSRYSAMPRIWAG